MKPPSDWSGGGHRSAAKPGPAGRPPRRRSSALRWGLSVQLVAILLRCFNRESSRGDQIVDRPSPKLQRFWRISTPSAAVIGVCRPALRIPRPTLMANLTPCELDVLARRLEPAIRRAFGLPIALVCSQAQLN